MSLDGAWGTRSSTHTHSWHAFVPCPICGNVADGSIGRTASTRLSSASAAQFGPDIEVEIRGRLLRGYGLSAADNFRITCDLCRQYGDVSGDRVGGSSVAVTDARTDARCVTDVAVVRACSL